MRVGERTIARAKKHVGSAAKYPLLQERDWKQRDPLEARVSPSSRTAFPANGEGPAEVPHEFIEIPARQADPAARPLIGRDILDLDEQAIVMAVDHRPCRY